jgi:hypothetical protein
MNCSRAEGRSIDRSYVTSIRASICASICADALVVSCCRFARDDVEL